MQSSCVVLSAVELIGAPLAVLCLHGPLEGDNSMKSLLTLNTFRAKHCREQSIFHLWKTRRVTEQRKVIRNIKMNSPVYLLTLLLFNQLCHETEIDMMSVTVL